MISSKSGSESKKSKAKSKPKAKSKTAPKADRKLLEMLVCPHTGQALRYDAERQELISDAAMLAYPIRDGIPIMLVKEARIIK